jgi:hypothetical protein
MPLDLTPGHLIALERIATHDFSIVSFPMYASAVGVRKENCVALLRPEPSGRFSFFGLPCYLVEGNLGVRCFRKGRDAFVWKKTEIPVTPQRLTELASFQKELQQLLGTDE